MLIYPIFVYTNYNIEVKKFTHLILVAGMLLYFPQHSIGQGQELIDSLKQVLPNADQSTRIKSFNKISVAYQRIDLDSSLLYAHKAYDEAIGTEFWSGQLSALDNMSMVYWAKQNHELSQAMIDSALLVSYQYESYPDIAYFENVSGSNHMQRGQYPAALLCFNRSLIALKKTGDERKMAFILNNLSNTYTRLGLYDKALEASIESLKIKERYDDEGAIAMSMINLAGINSKLDNNDVALDYYERALDIVTKRGDSLRMGRCLNNIGIIHRKKNNYSLAKEYNRKAQTYFLEMDSQDDVSSIYRSLSIIDLEQGDVNSSIANLEKSLEICEKHKDIRGRMFTLAGLGRAYLVKNEYEKSESYFLEVLQEAVITQNKEVQKDIQLNLSECYEKMNKPKQALKSFKIYSELSDSLLNQEKVKNLDGMQIRYETEKKEHEIQILKQQSEIDLLQIKEKDNELMRHKNIILISIAFFVLLTVIFYLLFNRYRLKQIANREKSERNALQLESRLLRSQMNPHFLFNSLNSIQSYISEANTFMAESYLSKFANLVRNILDHSRQNLITLDSEINSLKLYLEIEQLRFKRLFTFEMNVAEELQDDEFFVPPMLAQPFAENAIIHGLRHKQEEGKLVINFTRENDLIICTITDNGIGRERSAEINKTRKKKTSLGMQVTSERFEVLQQQMNSEASMLIEDLKEPEGNPIGTRVVLKIPFEQDV